MDFLRVAPHSNKNWLYRFTCTPSLDQSKPSFWWTALCNPWSMSTEASAGMSYSPSASSFNRSMTRRFIQHSANLSCIHLQWLPKDSTLENPLLEEIVSLEHDISHTGACQPARFIDLLLWRLLQVLRIHRIQGKERFSLGGTPHLQGLKQEMLDLKTPSWGKSRTKK